MYLKLILSLQKYGGQLDCKNTIVERTEESAFGEPTVKKYTRKNKEMVTY